jgi:hypothetical protein
MTRIFNGWQVGIAAPSWRSQAMRNFMIFCLGRTGSTTLMRLLNRHPEINCLVEPFNPSCHLEYAPQITDRRSLHTTLDQIYQLHNGIKHVADPDGWPFASTSSNYDLLEYNACRFILLTRINTLRRVVSSEIAHQAGIWHFWKLADRDAMRQFTFKDIDVGKVRIKIKKEALFLAECRRRLRGRRRQYCELAYESIFDNDIATDEKLSAIDDIVEFLDFPAFKSEKRYGEVAELLEVRNTGSDSMSAYRRIPNIDQIDTELGCDKTGWLFK